MVDNKTIYQVDAFTDEAFKGNPAGVMIVDDSFSDELMQHVATEMNLSETAFVTASNKGFNIRYFTPTTEMPLCGHATLASAHVMYQLGLKREDESIDFKAKGGDLTITKNGHLMVMVFPRYSLDKIATPDNFMDIVGFEPIEVYSSDYNWIVAISKDENDIEKANPNFELMKTNGLGHLMITSKSKLKNVDFVVRCFAPSLGINEDPVTGSAYCALTPLWSNKLGKKDMFSLQVSKRQGQVSVSSLGNQVEIKGKAITVFKAKLKI